MSEKKPLTPEQKAAIYHALHEAMQEDDKYPYEVIRDSYGGNEERYLRDVARSCGVVIDVE